MPRRVVQLHLGVGRFGAGGVGVDRHRAVAPVIDGKRVPFDHAQSASMPARVI
jgi:hypothetical protein